MVVEAPAFMFWKPPHLFGGNSLDFDQAL